MENLKSFSTVNLLCIHFQLLATLVGFFPTVVIFSLLRIGVYHTNFLYLCFIFDHIHTSALFYSIGSYCKVVTYSLQL